MATLHHTAVWFDISATDIERATRFYAAVLKTNPHIEKFPNGAMAILPSGEGEISGCLVSHTDGMPVGDSGVLLYLNVDGRIHEAVAQVEPNGGSIIEPTHPIGPHGFRAVIRDSEGNRIALHSQTDA